MHVKKRPTHIERDQYILKETYTVKRETYVHPKRESAQARQICQERPIHIKRDECILKETYFHQERESAQACSGTPNVPRENTLKHTTLPATPYNTLQHTATHYNTLQRTATQSKSQDRDLCTSKQTHNNYTSLTHKRRYSVGLFCGPLLMYICLF